MPPDSLVEPEDVESVIPVVLERGQNYFIDWWHNQIDGDVARRVLQALAGAPGMQLDRAELKVLESDEEDDG